MGQDVSHVKEGGDGRGTPHGGGGIGQGRILLKGQEGRQVCSRHQPAGMSQAHGVGRQYQDGAGERSLSESPEPLGKGRPVGGGPLPHHTYGSPAGKEDGGVQGGCPVPLNLYGIGDSGDGGCQPVDDPHGIEALQKDAPPRGGDGIEIEQFVQAHAVHVGQPVEPGGGQIEAPRPALKGRGVGDAVHQAQALQAGHGVVDGALGHGG